MTPDSPKFESACSAIRTRIREDERYLVRELFAISDMIAEAEKLFHPATPVSMPPGTRYGKAVYGIAEQLGRTAHWVDKLRQLQKIDGESRVLAEEQADGSLRMLLDLCAEPDVATRIRALNTRAPTMGRKTSMKRLLAGAAHPLRRVAQIFTDEKSELANLPGATALPPKMFVQYPELAGYETVAEVRDALRRPVATNPTRTSTSSPAQRVNEAAMINAAGVRTVTVRLRRDGTALRLGEYTLRFAGETDVDVVVEVLNGLGEGPGHREPSDPLTESPEDHLRSSTESGTEETNEAAGSSPAAGIQARTSSAAGDANEGVSHVVEFTAQADDIAAAIAAISMVRPPGMTSEGTAGYCFEVNDESDGPRGYVSARSGVRFARATFPVAEVRSAGRFAYPVEQARSFQYLSGEGLTFHAHADRGPDGHEGWHNFVSYTSTHGANSERYTDLHPEYFGNLLSKIEGSWTPLSAAVMREALEIAAPFAGGAREEPDGQVLQLLRNRSPGKLLAGDRLGSLVIECRDLIGKDFVVHRRHMPTLLKFLGPRRVGRVVEVAASPAYTFVRSGGQILGWAADEGALRIPEDGTWVDTIIVSIPRQEAVALLSNFRLRRPSSKYQQQITRAVYRRVGDQPELRVAEGIAVSVQELLAPPSSAEQTWRVGVQSFTRLFQGASSARAEVRVGFFSSDPDKTILRTVDQFVIEGHTFRVTRSCACVS